MTYNPEIMSEKKSDSNHQLFLKYFQNTATPEEIHALEAWLRDKPGNLNEFNSYLKLWAASELLKPGFKKQELSHWEALKKEIQNKTARTHKKVPFFHSFTAVLKVAALIIVFATLGWFLHMLSTNLRTEPPSFSEVSTPRGSRSKVILPDRSVVWLNAGSTLKYADEFSGKPRDVYLDGEAYFNVVEDKKRLFVVRTSDILIRVYGTVFNVKSYPEEGTIETTLIKGRIAISKNQDKRGSRGHQVYLEPNQKATYIRNEGRIALSDLITPATTERQSLKSGSIIINENIDSEKVASWHLGQLIMDQEPLRELAIKLERKYDVHFVFENDDLEQFRFTGILEDETLEQVLYAMQLTAPIVYRIDRKTVYLNFLPGYIQNEENTSHD